MLSNYVITSTGISSLFNWTLWLNSLFLWRLLSAFEYKTVSFCLGIEGFDYWLTFSFCYVTYPVGYVVFLTGFYFSSSDSYPLLTQLVFHTRIMLSEPPVAK
jgi:hypothetical protein